MNYPYEDIARSVLHTYSALPRTGKPDLSREWTHLAGIVMLQTKKTCSGHASFDVSPVAIGTGSRCLGASKLPVDGSRLHDSHAEVVVRRAFLVFLLDEIEKCLSNEEESKIFQKDGVKCRLKPGITFHMFVSHTPCGDASIFPKSEKELIEERNGASKRDAQSEDGVEAKRLKLENNNDDAILEGDLHRTGAKCVPGNDNQDPLLPGINYHVTGALRYKPGRGDRTSSMSCSDKIAKWGLLGLQGALVSLLLSQPIFLTSLVFAQCPYDEKAVRRALVDRTLPLREKFKKNLGQSVPELILRRVDQKFDQGKVAMETSLGKKLKPCPSSISWTSLDGREDIRQVFNNGFKQGVVKKREKTETAQVYICRRQILKRFVDAFDRVEAVSNFASLRTLKYLELKQKASWYQIMKELLTKDVIFRDWIVTSEHTKNFSLET